MKIVNSDTIESSEKEFIDTINAELDWVSIEKMILEKHKLKLQDEVLYKQGDIVIHNNQIAYRLDFDIIVSLSLTFNRDGECLNIQTSDEPEEIDEIFSDVDSQANSDTDDLDALDSGDEELNPEITSDAQSYLENDSEVALNEFEQLEMDVSQNLPEQKNWSKMAPELAEMINDINQDSR
ncbi:conserved hypothetical protein [Desulfamplus magnetovallimortis]|uniref:Uncharacterized protein n=1 Tax=Desulfamplus magnetovallimortis TaxID=1246637 RepID=A0A1W1HCB4_9BACT|nr:hypothetical protein [Desulfamplus magnetovallimortis]SLM30134.1 conserved hypothetical protein [Desulfamplus magnetovallimortis]